MAPFFFPPLHLSAMHRSLASLLLMLSLAGLTGCPAPGGGADGGTLPDGGKLLPDGGSGGPDLTPRLAAATARAAGRRGQDVVVRVTGTDANADVAALEVALLDGAGAEVAAYARNPGKDPNTGTAWWPFEASLAGKKSFTDVQVRLEDVREALPAIASVRVTVLDARGQRSEAATVEVQDQPEAQLGEGCDKELVLNRCIAGAACKGTPGLCAEGGPPVVTKLTYARTDAGYSVIRWTGTDADDDATELQFTFADANDQPINGDLDGDGTPEASQYLHDVTGSGEDGKFVGGLEPSFSFVDSVPRLVVKPKDAAGNEGAVVSSPLAWMPVRTAGQSCDPLGSDTCKAGSACYPGVPGTSNACQPLATARKRRCDAAPVLDFTAGERFALGELRGASGFTPTCAEAQAYPDSVVKLKLSEPVARLVLTTDNASTAVDTILTVLSGPCDGNATVVACNDDSVGVSTQGSTVELTNLPAGTYAVVIDSYKPEGGRFLLQASEP
ncbi:MAG: hypothetical protein FJ086_16365 [Deltaproteobacteria bacterium]|nr:hypothetical protein [Deltaproteobacteria bacterium]